LLLGGATTGVPDPPAMVDPQSPVTLPPPLERNVAVAAHPAVIVNRCGAAPPSATGLIGFGFWNDGSELDRA
jgi:hypothetical protein